MVNDCQGPFSTKKGTQEGGQVTLLEETDLGGESLVWGSPDSNTQ